jgi:hypothetical protein
MPSLESLLVAAGAGMFLLLGSVHLLYTFRGNKLHPRDPALVTKMQETHPVLTRETTMWKAWVGFNASHSTGAMLYGLVYGYLALAQPAVLFGSPFLLGLGAIFVAFYAFLGKAYWFRIPYRGILFTVTLYAIALVLVLRAG